MSVVVVGTGCAEGRLGDDVQRHRGYSCGHWRGRSDARVDAPGGSRAARPSRYCSAQAPFLALKYTAQSTIGASPTSHACHWAEHRLRWRSAMTHGGVGTRRAPRTPPSLDFLEHMLYNSANSPGSPHLDTAVGAVCRPLTGAGASGSRGPPRCAPSSCSSLTSASPPSSAAGSRAPNGCGVASSGLPCGPCSTPTAAMLPPERAGPAIPTLALSPGTGVWTSMASMHAGRQGVPVTR